MYYDFFCNRKALTPPQWRSWASEEDAMPSDSSNPFISRDDLLQLIRKEFTSLDPHFGEKRGDLLGALKAPADEVAARQQAGLPAACANQILLEISWLANYRDDWDRAKRRLVDLQKALAQPDKLEPTQDDEGSWGACCEEWYRKLEPTVDALQEVTDSTPKLKPLRFMEKLQDAQATLDLLYRLQITDIRNTRKNQRDELGAMQTALSQMIFKDGLRDLLIDRPELGFSISPELEASYTDYLQQTQHPRTGYWGPWYRFGERLVMVQDLAFTFHVINYRAGNVGKWPLIIDSTLEIEKLIYPAGWAPKGGGPYNNHNNYDVAVIFALGWPHMSSSQKARVRDRLKSMLDWCLTTSLDANGFKLDGNSPADAYYYGVRFLDRVGLWDPAKRFWLHRAPALPAGLPPPLDLSVKLLQSFEKLNDKSAESDTVRAILRTAACTSGSAP
jgi:hypothetical protein